MRGLCRPTDHHWRCVAVFATGLAGPDQRQRVVSIQQCTQCPAALELTGDQHQATKHVADFAAWLWLPGCQPEAVVTTDAQGESKAAGVGRVWTSRRRV